MVRRSDKKGVAQLPNRDDLEIVEGDLRDSASIQSALKSSEPDEIYNLAAPTFVQSSYKDPVLTADVVGLGAMRVMEAARLETPHARLFQALSSEMFAGADSAPQNEQTPYSPRTSYGAAKAFASVCCDYYRERHGMFVAGGIFYNHESPRRPPEFVTRKITLGVARISVGLQSRIELGNLNAKRDWGYAPEYVDAAWRSLQRKSPENYVIATGEIHSVRELLEEACRVAGVSDPMSRVRIDDRLKRSVDSTNLVGDITKARKKLRWAPRITFRRLVKMMVEADLRAAKEEAKKRGKR